MRVKKLFFFALVSKEAPPAATERLARPTRIPTPTATASVTSGRRWSPPSGRIGSFALWLGDQKRKKVTEITDGVTLPRICHMARYTPLAKREIRHDLDFGQHGHPALHMMLHTASCRKEYGLRRRTED